jgi:hypothetical protein
VCPKEEAGVFQHKMAAIEKRVSKDGKISYRAKIRLKGHPPQSATFNRITDAKMWIQQTEAVTLRL